MTYRSRRALKLHKNFMRRDHSDDWLMTYADMITLLLCFFAVFLTVTVQKKDITARLQKPDHPLLHAFGAPDAVENNTPLETKPNIVVPVNAQVGHRITALQMGSSAFFENGAATLTEEGVRTLLDEAALLKSAKYKDYIITIEGHTDDSPVNSSLYPSNWELSAARASAVVHFFINSGIPAYRLRAAGYADTFPRAPNRDAHGAPIPENQAKNRRVVIKLEKMEEAE